MRRWEVTFGYGSDRFKVVLIARDRNHALSQAAGLIVDSLYKPSSLDSVMIWEAYNLLVDMVNFCLNCKELKDNE